MKKRGISLIVLIITIIVIIILAGVIILNLTKNNPINSAKKAKFLNDIDTFKSELSLYELGKMTDTNGDYNPKLLNSGTGGTTENGDPIDKDKVITHIITTMENTRYPDILEVIAGELVYIGNNEEESNWGDGVIPTKDFKINISTVPDMTSISGKITLSGVLVDEQKIEYYKIYLSQTSGTYQETENIKITDKKSEVEFKLENLIANGEYYIKVEVKMDNEPDVRILESGKIVTKPDNITPNTPQIIVPEYSNRYQVSPVTITLTDDEGGSGISESNSRYIIDQISTNYEEDNNIWQVVSSEFNLNDFIGDTATLALNVQIDGEYYIHVLSVDNAGNKKSGVSSKIIVDTTAPNEALIVIPQTTTNNSIQATVTMSDNAGGSGLNISQCKYIYSAVSYPYGDTESIWNSATAFASATQTITVTSSTNDIYYVHVLIVDKAGNRREVLSSGVTTNTTTPLAPVITGTIAANTWTNQNVTLTVNEVTSPNIIRYEYSINGGVWQTYNSTNKIVISSDGVTTIKARAVNNIGTIGAESIGYMVSIDKTNPTVSFGTNGGSNLQIASSVVTALDTSGSGINASTLQYVWSTSTTAPSSGWLTFSNGTILTKSGTSGSYYLWIKVNDNAGNSITTKSNIFTVIEYLTSNPPGTEANPGTPKNENSTVDGKTPTYNNPVIPAGFNPVNTQDASWNNISTDWNNGLVIQDIYGNQFVWVPVDGTNVKYEKWTTSGLSYTSTTDDTLPSGFSVSNITNKYKGFYISRYESAFDYNGGSIRAASKKSSNKATTNWSAGRTSLYNGFLWNHISYSDALTYSVNMANAYGHNTSFVGTNLITGAQWDTVLKWVQNSGKSVTDSRTWGNYVYSSSPANVSGYGSLQISGYSDYWKAKNIYDLAGNIWEWTSERYSVDFVYRGGAFSTDGGNIPAAYRNHYVDNSISRDLGFRIALYIK